MATCGHCKKPGQTVAHVRTCGQAGAVATATLPQLTPGNVVTLAGANGPMYWLVLAAVPGTHPYEVQLIRASGEKGARSYIRLEDVEMVFPDLNSAADYRIAIDTEATKRRNREILHGDPDYCRGCAKGWQGAKWHRDGCPVIAAREAKAAAAVAEDHAETQAYRAEQARESGNPWAPVNDLRNRIKPHLNRETKRGKVRHFALGEDETAKFYRVKELPNGRVYVDAVAGGSQHDHDGVTYPVKNPSTLVEVLTAILADPDYAAKRYGQLLTRCSDCNRTLTDSTSRALGIGPECRSKL